MKDVYKRQVYASMDWIHTTMPHMYMKAKCNEITVYENEQPGVDYIIKKVDEASLREPVSYTHPDVYKRQAYL